MLAVKPCEDRGPICQSGLTDFYLSSHEEAREKGPDLSEHLDDGVSSSELVRLVVARANIHDRWKVAGFE